MAILICAACGGRLQETGAAIHTAHFDAQGNLTLGEPDYYCRWCARLLEQWQAQQSKSWLRTGRAAPAVRRAEEIRLVVSGLYHLQPDDLLSRSRRQNVSCARMVAITLAHRLTGLSTVAVGKLFERDHSTVIHALQVTARRAQEQPQFGAKLARLEADLRTRARVQDDPGAQEEYA